MRRFAMPSTRRIVIGRTTPSVGAKPLPDTSSPFCGIKTMSNKTLELALTVLRRGTGIKYHEELEERKQAIKGLEAMIEHQDPVAYVTGFHNGHCVIQPTDPALVLPVGMALYRVPKEWVGLTDEEISAVDWKPNETLHDYARHIELKLRGKNT